MDYKEKYKQGLECIQEILSGAGDSIKTSILRKRLQPFFPELKEYEDERIRKAIIEFFELQDDNTTYSFIPKKDILAWLEKQGEQKQTWKPSAAQLIVIKDLIEDKNTSKANKVILQGMFDEFKQFTNSQSSLFSSGHLLDSNKVIAWLVANICDFEYYVKLFKKRFRIMTQDKKDFIETMLTWFRSPQVGNDEEFDRKFLASAYDNITQPHWISVEDELPTTSDRDDESDDYLIVDSDGDMNVGYYNKMDELWFSCDGHILDVTHWMPLPQAPLVTDLNKKDLPPLGHQDGNILVEKEGGEE